MGDTLTFLTKPELTGMAGLISPAPDAYVAVENNRYLVEVLSHMPLRSIKYRIEQYREYFESNEWQENTDKPFPAIALLIPDTDQTKRIQKIVNDEPDLRFVVSSGQAQLLQPK